MVMEVLYCIWMSLVRLGWRRLDILLVGSVNLLVVILLVVVLLNILWAFFLPLSISDLGYYRLVKLFSMNFISSSKYSGLQIWRARRQKPIIIPDLIEVLNKWLLKDFSIENQLKCLFHQREGRIIWKMNYRNKNTNLIGWE